MRFAFLFVVSIFSLIGSARAQDAPKSSPLTIGQCLDVLSGLNAVSQGYTQVVKENGQDRVIPQQYKLGGTRLKIALDIGALKPVADGIEKVRQGFVAEIFGGKEPKNGTPEMARFSAEMQKLLDQPCSVAPGHIAISDLKIGEAPENNPIPPATISLLLPILDQ